MFALLILFDLIGGSMRKLSILTTLFLLFVWTVTVIAQTLKPLRIEHPPVIDGVLDDAVWQDAPSETGFKTWNPDYGLDMSEKTRVWYAYDREHLYFAFKCFDSEPDKIKSSVTARDKIRSDDWICLNLDTFNDQQSLYALYTNPAGIQMDSRAIGDDEDFSIDVVWYSEGRIDDEGYSIEIRIPFKSIRYSPKDPVKMGIIFERRISRTSEMGTYPALDPMQGPNFYTQTRTLEYRDIKHYRLIEFLPGVTYGSNSAIGGHNEDKEKLEKVDDMKEVSLTTKLGITSHLVMDGTVNPDFSQVESDAGQVDFNQRHALFYAEKRPFFLEGQENFNFGGATHGDPLEAVVHTRTIINPLIGGKLTGKVGSKNTMGVVYAYDEPPSDYNSPYYNRFLTDLWSNHRYSLYRDTSHVAIFRYKRALNQDSFIGGFITDRESDHAFNRVVGADAQIRINGSSRIGFHGFMSQTGIKSPSYDETGFAYGINYYYNTRDWLMNIRFHDLSDDFWTETGYVTRTGITRIRAGFLKRLYPKSNALKRIDPLLNNQFIYDKESQRWENSNGAYLTFVLPRSTSIRIGYLYASEIFITEKFSISNANVHGRSHVTKQFSLNFYYSYGKKIRYVSDPYQGRGHTFAGSVTYQPSENFESNLNYAYSDLTRDSNDEHIFDYSIIRSRNTYQVNKYLFFRAIVEYNSFYEEMTTDFLASFTYIPGTVIHVGYGSRYNKLEWKENHYQASDRFLETKRGFFFKASYLWRL